MRQRNYPLACRFIAILLVCLWSLPLAVLPTCSGIAISGIPYFNTQQPTRLSIAYSQVVVGEKAHNAICRCLNCPGGKRCCCLRAHTNKESLCFRSVCDRETTVAASVATIKTVPFPSRPTISFPVGPVIYRAFRLWDAAAPSRSPHPPFLPPRLS